MKLEVGGGLQPIRYCIIMNFIQVHIMLKCSALTCRHTSTVTAFLHASIPVISHDDTVVCSSHLSVRLASDIL